MEQGMESKSRTIYLLKSVLLSFLITLFLLLLISFIMLKTGMPGSIVSVMVIAIYVISVFSGGFYMGKHVPSKRYLWGLIASLVFFLVYLLVSFLLKEDTASSIPSYLKTLAIFACSGTIGGMLS